MRSRWAAATAWWIRRDSKVHGQLDRLWARLGDRYAWPLEGFVIASSVLLWLSGARGYVLKGADHEEIVRAIEALAAGAAIFGPGVAQRVMRFFAGAASVSPKPFPDLTDREREVLELVAQGLGNAEITRRLVVSPKTVRNHVSNILGKLQVADRSQAIVRAREAGLGREQARPEQLRTIAS